MTALPLPFVLATRNADKAREIVEIFVALDRRAARSRTRSTAIAFLVDAPDRIAASVAALPALARRARRRGDRRHARGERADQGDARSPTRSACSRSPTTPASRSTRSTARPACTRRATRASDATYADNVAKLLRELEGVVPALRTARFATVAIARWPDGREVVGARRGRGRDRRDAARARAASATTRCSSRSRATAATFAEMTAAEKHADLAPGPRVRGARRRHSRPDEVDRAWRCIPSAEMMIQVLADSGLGVRAPTRTPESARAAMIAATTNRAAPEAPGARRSTTARSRARPATIPVRVFRPSAAAGAAAARVVPRRRLGHRQPRHPRPARAGMLCDARRRGRRVGRLPARARGQVPRRGRRLPRRVDVGRSRTRPRSAPTPDRDRDRRRQRGRQPRRGRRARSRASAGCPQPRCSCSCTR